MEGGASLVAKVVRPTSSRQEERVSPNKEEVGFSFFSLFQSLSTLKIGFICREILLPELSLEEIALCLILFLNDTKGLSEKEITKCC